MLRSADVPTADYHVFSAADEASRFIKDRYEAGEDVPVVVKADGLARLAELTGDTIEVDLQDVPRANTVTIAVLTAWHRAAKLQNKSMVFMNLSPELRNIIDFSGLQNILSLCSKS